MQTTALTALTALALLASGAALQDDAPSRSETSQEIPMQVRYLEIVTPDVDGTCAALERAHGVEFGEPVPELGQARTTRLADGGRIGVRAPMHAAETPVVRPYLGVHDIEAAVAAAEAAGAQIAHPPLEIPGQGTFAIYLLGGNQFGLWKD